MKQLLLIAAVICTAVACKKKDPAYSYVFRVHHNASPDSANALYFLDDTQPQLVSPLPQDWSYSFNSDTLIGKANAGVSCSLPGKNPDDSATVSILLNGQVIATKTRKEIASIATP